jgi:hypothetical protein
MSQVIYSYKTRRYYSREIKTLQIINARVDKVAVRYLQKQQKMAKLARRERAVEMLPGSAASKGHQ